MIRIFALDKFNLVQYRLPSGEYFFTSNNETLKDEDVIKTRLKSSIIFNSSNKLTYSSVKIPMVFLESNILTIHNNKDDIKSYELYTIPEDHVTNLPIPFFKGLKVDKNTDNSLIKKWSLSIRELETKRRHELIKDLLQVVRVFNSNLTETISKSDCALQFAEDLLKEEISDDKRKTILNEMDNLFGLITKLLYNNSTLETRTVENQKILSSIYNTVDKITPDGTSSPIKNDL